MMLDKEERVLMTDSDTVKKQAGEIRDMKLANAVRAGISKGRKREMRRIYSYGAAAIAAAAAAVFIVFSFTGFPDAGGNEKMVQTASPKSVTDIESFRQAAARDQGFAAALEQGLVKPVKLGVEKNGYRIDVAGAVADGRTAYILYSLQNHTKSAAIPIEKSLEFGGVKAPSEWAKSIATLNRYNGNHYIGNETPAGDTGYYVYATHLLPTAKYNKDAKLSIKIWDTATDKNQEEFDVTFDFDTNMLKDKEQAYYPDRTLTIAGQNIKVRQLLYTPLQTYVDLEYDPANEKQVFNLINPVLIGKSGDQSEKIYYPTEILKDKSQTTLLYKRSRLEQPDKASLKVFGISAVNKDQLKLVIDLQKKEIVEAPDDLLRIIAPEPGEKSGAGEIFLERKLEHVQVAESFDMSLDDSFTDANGETHKRLPSENVSHGGLTRSKDTFKDEKTYNFGKDALDYPQPLTIRLEKYWIPVMDTQSVELIAKQ
ncbi:DUF4179 domain-containing protein [Paenibacillus azoreducens]|uniref:DUF4179 domain-containing protein n=1 Tax=Paenibacillus azoreducens TaxID=116718 RepID=UPI0039F5FA07